LPSGLTGSSTTRAITITASSINTYAIGTIKVTATNACGTSVAQSSASAVTVVCPSSVTDSEGNTYPAAKFGTAGCWMTQNLRSTTGLTANSNAGSNTSLKYYWYPNNKQTTFNSHPEYGLLYTWAAASGRTNVSTYEGNNSSTQTQYQGICPNGWHLPSDYEWNQLEEAIAKSAKGDYSTTAATTWNSSYSTDEGYRGTHGRKMKSKTSVGGQATSGTSNTSSANGFDVLLVGAMSEGKAYHYPTYSTFWTSSCGSAGSAGDRYLYYGESGMYRNPYGDKLRMYSVRCKGN
jgi:uncharacterized protein (TIGR02145 family)